MATRALIHLLPPQPQRGETFELRVTLGHPNESGQRVGADGQVLRRSIVTRFECRRDATLVFAADLYPAIAANPYLAFWLRHDGPATLRFDWLGDDGFAHRETRSLA